jgi:hypothetical protein
VDLLCLRGGSDLAGANSPDRLVGNDNAGPLLSGDGLSDGTELSSDDGDGLALLALLEGLAAAEDDADTLVEGVLGLGGDELVGLLEDDTALGVADQGPADVGVLKLGGGDLAGEGALVLVEDVLGSDLDLLAELGACEKEVECGRGDDDLCGIALDIRIVKTAGKCAIYAFEGNRHGWLGCRCTRTRVNQSSFARGNLSSGKSSL